MACTPAQPDVEVRKGPWTIEEDLILINYIANHGEGVWNSLAKAAGLKRTGKSCRLRWLNYLRPDVRRGNITTDERLLIMELHAKWGNRWSKIAKHLPGRTDNEIKNYWRTRIQKNNKQADELWSSQLSNISKHEKASTSQVEDQAGNTSYMPCWFNTTATTTTTTSTIEESSMETYCPSSFDHSCNYMDTSNPTDAALEPYANYWNIDHIWPMHLFNDN